MKILVVEDERELREILKSSLEESQHLVEFAEDYSSAIFKIEDYDYDCILLDIMLPGGNGLEILKALKSIKPEASVIIVSAKDSVEDKVAGLNLGADDYLSKPFHLVELHSRINSVLRRKNRSGENTIRYKNIELFPDERFIKINHQEVTLNRKEYDILYYFMIRPNRLIQKTTLAESVWGDYIDQADSLDFIYSQIKNLRKKLKDYKANADIKAVYGVGYKLV